MTMRSTSGISASWCQTIAGSAPPILVSAAIMSRSRLRPGNTRTAAFIRSPEGLWCSGGIGFLSDVVHHALVLAVNPDQQLLAITPQLIGSREVTSGCFGACLEADGGREVDPLGAEIVR